MNIISVINLATVGLFGTILSAGFCTIRWTWKKGMIMSGSICASLLFHGIFCLFTDVSTVKYFSPLITHVPLIIVLRIVNGEFLWSSISVLIAYLFCQVRRWLALFAVALFSCGTTIQDIVELIITLPLLFLILYFFAPSFRTISNCTTNEKCWFGLVPLLYYVFDYMTTSYTNLLPTGSPVVVEFMPFVCSLTYLMFVLRASQTEKIRIQMEQTQQILNLQVTQSVREIAALRESQQKTITHRHDLRHHMQFILSCIENERTNQAQVYIHKICSEIEAAKVIVYCENEATNLILSAFSKRTQDYDISISIKASIPREIRISENDWCVLLSNALENALHSCQKIKEKGLPCLIDVSSYEKKGKLFLQISNSCVEEDIIFSHGIPVASKPNHGIGIRSICTIVEHYGGIYNFSVQNGLFILRVSL